MGDNEPLRKKKLSEFVGIMAGPEYDDFEKAVLELRHYHIRNPELMDFESFISDLNRQREERIEKEIEDLLFPDKEIPFEKLLKDLTEKNILTSRTTLAKYLDRLHKKKRIKYRRNPKNKRSTLYFRSQN